MMHTVRACGATPSLTTWLRPAAARSVLCSVSPLHIRRPGRALGHLPLARTRCRAHAVAPRLPRRDHAPQLGDAPRVVPLLGGQHTADSMSSCVAVPPRPHR